MVSELILNPNMPEGVIRELKKKKKKVIN